MLFSYSVILSTLRFHCDFRLLDKSLQEMTTTSHEVSESFEAGSAQREDYVPSKPPTRILLGMSSFASSQSLRGMTTNSEPVRHFLSTFRSRGYFDIDTVRAYASSPAGSCEKFLGCMDLEKWANVSTKISSLERKSHSICHLKDRITCSSKAYNNDIDIMYLRASDMSASLFETCQAIDQAYKQGKFARFGLFDCSVREISNILRICEENVFVKPSVYQGEYNLFCRRSEQSLFDILRQNDIAFYAYNPAACESSLLFLDPNNQAALIPSPLSPSSAHQLFHDRSFVSYAKLSRLAKSFGLCGHAVALRWTVYHSRIAAEKGDGIIMEAANVRDLERNLDILEQGPLPDLLVEHIDAAWKS